MRLTFHVLFWLSLFGAYWPVVAQTSEESTSYTLEECIEYALKNSASIKNALLEKDISKAKVGETRAQGLPQVNAAMNFTNNYQLRKSLLDASIFDPEIPPGTEVPFAFGRQIEGFANLNATQLIFDGSYFVGLKAAKTFQELATKDHIKTKIDVIEAVNKAYFGVLVSQEQLKFLENNYGRLDSLLTETQEMYKNGFVEKLDVDRIRVNFNTVKIQKTNLERLNEISVELLKFQMGVPIQTDIVLKGSLEDITLDESLIDGEEREFNYQSRIEYSQLLTNEVLLGLDMKNNKVQYLPRLSAFFNYGYNTNGDDLSQYFQFNDRWLNNGSFGLDLSIPIFDGLRKSYKIQQNKVQLKQMSNTKKQFENAIDVEISTATKQLRNNLEMLKSQKENMDLAEEIYNISKIKYQEGVGSNLEIINADTDFKEAQTEYFNTLYNALISKVDLLKAFGRLEDK